MPSNAENAIESLQDQIGKAGAPSDWLTVDQDRINQFADATGDHQFIHVDTERAKSTPWGTTIAHGFLTLSLIPHLADLAGSDTAFEGLQMGVNYGLDKVRFVSPVPVGSRVRATSETLEVKLVDPNTVQTKAKITIEIDGGKRPACIAEQLTRLYFA